VVEGFRSGAEANVGNRRLTLSRPGCFDVIWRLGLLGFTIGRYTKKKPMKLCRIEA
jgi:hypothetical protein